MPEAQAIEICSWKGCTKAATHSYPVKWFSKTAPLSRFGKDADILTDENVPLWEVENAKLRSLIRDQVPLGYNRFRKFRWLIALAFILHLVRFLIGELGGEGVH